MSSGRFWAELWMVLVLLVIATGLLAHSGVDLQLASFFHQADGWPIGEQFPWKLLYRIDRTPAVLLALGWLAVLAWSYYRPGLISWRRAAIFMALLLIMGPGLLVNSVFKEHWGRPRPREVTQFDGSKQFLQPWQPGISGKGRSLPSGHSSAAFYLATPWFVYRKRKPLAARCWFWGGIVFGLLMSVARIAQGGHFLTDCLWAFGMVWLTGQVLAAVLLPEQENGEEAVK
jgi:lipid A 4'-phosphatase